MAIKAYITGSGCISPQNTTDENYFFETIIGANTDYFPAIEPSYKEHISPNLLRRMGRAIKMGSSAARMAITEAKLENVDAIISGTGLGCFEDSEKFLLAIINNDEQFLTPTSFIQSTHNTVGSQVALIMKCHQYNYTYTHRGFSFETCIMDALMCLAEGKKNILIGGIEEHTPLYVDLNRNAKKFNTDTNHAYYEGKNHGIQIGEGAAFFAISSEKQNATSSIDGVAMVYKPESSDELLQKLNQFLQHHNQILDTIDVVMFGFSGDCDYDKFLLELHPLIANTCATAQFKNSCGDYHTAGAFATWVANKILQKQEIPHTLRINHHSKSVIQSVLIINAYIGVNYSFTLISKC